MNIHTNDSVVHTMCDFIVEIAINDIAMSEAKIVLDHNLQIQMKFSNMDYSLKLYPDCTEEWENWSSINFQYHVDFPPTDLSVKYLLIHRFNDLIQRHSKRFNYVRNEFIKIIRTAKEKLISNNDLKIILSKDLTLHQFAKIIGDYSKDNCIHILPPIREPKRDQNLYPIWWKGELK